ncbi:MAG TPA: ABC transporter substrate-binding protein [Kofleriaceae bacterium]|nr:ABC transporter substrate-binding protein [Kofleriaceae bacterium]
MLSALRTCAMWLCALAAACDARMGTMHHRRDPGALVVAQAADISGLDLVRVSDSESIEVGEILFEGLVKWRPGTTDVEPALAMSWQVSPDALRWTFELRRGVVFHDGTPLDADAVVGSFERVIDAGHPSYLRGDDALYWRTLLKDLRRVTARGPTTVELEIARPYAPLLGQLAMFPIVSPAAVRRWRDDFRLHPAGTGAFAFESWDAGDQVVVKRFDRYWGARPALERIVFRVVIDARQRLVDLQSGSVDLAAAILPDEQSFVELHPDLVLHHMASHDVSYLAFNLSRAGFADRRVRRAVSHAINKEPIVKLAYQGRAIAAETPLPPGEWGYHVPAIRYGYEPATAKRLLDEAIADRAFDPSRVYKLYAPTTPRPYLAQPERIARYLQAAMAQLGVRTELVLQPVALHRLSVARGEHDLALFGWISETGDPDNLLYVLLHSDNATPGSAQNIAFYRSPVVDELLSRAQTATDQEARGRLYAEVLEIVAQDAPWVPLVHSELVVAARAELEGVRLTPFGHPLYPLIRRRGMR